MRTLYTGGSFDIFHYGHMNFLKKCRILGDYIIVALNTDEFITSYKGKPPIMNYNEREKALLLSCYVDKVIPNVGGADSKPAILSAKPKIIAIGDDWAHKDYFTQMDFTQDWLDENNIVLTYLPYTKGISTTDLKLRIINDINSTQRKH